MARKRSAPLDPDGNSSSANPLPLDHTSKRRKPNPTTTTLVDDGPLDGPSAPKPSTAGPRKPEGEERKAKAGKLAQAALKRALESSAAAVGAKPGVKENGHCKGKGKKAANGVVDLTSDQDPPKVPEAQQNGNDKEEEVIESPEAIIARRKAKGKGRAMDIDIEPQPQPSLGSPRRIGRQAAIDEDVKQMRRELERLKKEVRSKDEMLVSQSGLVQSVRSSLTCTVCLETLDSPYALACGHIFCHKDLYSWFHRPDPEVHREESVYGSDGLSDDEEDHESSDSEGSDPDFAAAVAASLLDRPVNGHGPATRSNGSGARVAVPGPVIHGADAGPALQPVPALPRPRPRAPRLHPATRQRNLVCPQCRAPVSDSAPLQLWAVKEAADALRKAEAAATGSGAGSVELPDLPAGTAESHRDEKDKTWGDLFNQDNGDGRGGRGRGAMRDIEDGVRRCFECNWEVSAEGLCEGCGAAYSDIEGSDSLDDEDDDRSSDEGTRFATDEEDLRDMDDRRHRIDRAVANAINDGYLDDEVDDEDDAEYEDEEAMLSFILPDARPQVYNEWNSESESEDDSSTLGAAPQRMTQGSRESSGAPQPSRNRSRSGRRRRARVESSSENESESEASELEPQRPRLPSFASDAGSYGLDSDTIADFRRESEYQHYGSDDFVEHGGYGEVYRGDWAGPHGSGSSVASSADEEEEEEEEVRVRAPRRRRRVVASEEVESEEERRIVSSEVEQEQDEEEEEEEVAPRRRGEGSRAAGVVRSNGSRKRVVVESSEEEY